MPTNTMVLDIYKDGQAMALDIANKFDDWKLKRREAEDEWEEIKRYIYATSTHDTGVNSLPFRNSTTTPKICQLFEQLAALTYNIKFGGTSWVKFESQSREDAMISKKNTMNAFITKLLEDSGFYSTALQLDYDLYLHGNCFAKVEYDREINNAANLFNQDQKAAGFSGARLVRISPYDIVFNPLATSFAKSPKIVRKMTDYATFIGQVQSNPDLYDNEQMESLKTSRRHFTSMSSKDRAKINAFQIDGFGSMEDYYESGTIELLEFFGDIYDEANDVLYKNRTIIIADRRFVIMNEENNVELGEGLVFHNADRKRPDNLWGQSRLANLTGLQFMIDKLSNGIADAVDFIIAPPVKEKGAVGNYQWRPGAKIPVDMEGDVEQMPIDARFLSVDFKIDKIMNYMEMFAGLPSQAMGFKTKGEKTLGEVQMLDSSALRQFSVGVKNQERMFWQPIVNCMFQQSKANMLDSETIKMVGDENVEIFKSITTDDLSANGGFKPVGTERFDKILKLQSDLMMLSNSSLMQMDTVNAHLSGFNIAKMLGELTGLDQYDVIKKNIKIDEMAELQLAQAQTQQEMNKYMAQAQMKTQQERDVEEIAQTEQDTLDLVLAEQMMAQRDSGVSDEQP